MEPLASFQQEPSVPTVQMQSNQDQDQQDHNTEGDVAVARAHAAALAMLGRPSAVATISPRIVEGVGWQASRKAPQSQQMPSRLPAPQELTPSKASTRLRPISFRAEVEWQKEIRDAFETFDVDGRGSVDYRELKVAMRALGLPARKADFQRLMREHGCSDNSQIEFDTFSRIIMQRFREQDPLEGALKAFTLFDKNGRGRIGIGDLRRVSRELTNPLTDNELQEMVERFSEGNGDGEITESTFARIMETIGLW
jgi:Ca2+-binding EF-hand superfamily protein